MIKKLVFLAFLITSMLFATSAFALFTNGGFETGDLTGWTVEQGVGSYSDYSINWSATGSQFAGAVTSTSEGFTAGGVNAYNGTYMAKIGDLNGGFRATRISQTGNVTAQDIADGGIYVNWGAVLNNPAGHPIIAQPYFGISVDLDGSVTSFQTDATTASATWTSIGNRNYYNTDTWFFDLTSAVVGDPVTVSLFVVDCGYGAHGAYALLDGIGTRYVPPGDDDNEVPEPATMLLLGLGLAGLAGLRRRTK